MISTTGSSVDTFGGPQIFAFVEESGDLDGNGSLDYRFTWTTILGASGTNTLQLFLGCRDTELPFRESYP
jgi:hypothetical protein